MENWKLFPLVALIAGCGVQHLPPPTVPERVLPPVEASGPPAQGRGRVLLDVDGDRAVVEDVSGGSVAASGAGHFFSGSLEVSQGLCQTPCYVDLPPGPHMLRFLSLTDSTRSGDGYVNVDTGVSAYREVMGVHRHHPIKRFFGITTAVLGGLFLIDTPDAYQRDHRVGSDMLVTGAGLAVLGWWLIHTSAGVEQPGAGVQWPVAGPASARN